MLLELASLFGRRTRLAALALFAAATGCAPTQYTAVAPAARSGYVYVTGMRGSRSLLLLCPSVPGAMACTEVDVTEE